MKRLIRPGTGALFRQFAVAVIFAGCAEGGHSPAGAAASAYRVPEKQAAYASLLPSIKTVGKRAPFNFAVLGDNRGAVTGTPSPVFLKIIDRLNRENLAFVLNTGDMIRGYTSDRYFLGEQWKGYLGAIATMKAPIFHAPGNHDWFDPASAKAYLETVGPSYFAFDYDRVRIVALDTESDPGRIGEDQFGWLSRELENAAGKDVFVFFHRPVFPADGHKGSSLDEHPMDRDRLHSLFVRYRDRIRAVLAGHEHIYNYERRDGIAYYITGGGGADLYAEPEKGGFFHYLLVSVSPKDFAIELKKIEIPKPPEEPRKPAVRVDSGRVLEGWETAGPVMRPAKPAEGFASNLTWSAWDESVSIGRTTTGVTEGAMGLGLRYNFGICEWPLLYAGLNPGWNLSSVKRMMVDVFVGESAGGTGSAGDALSVVPALLGRDSIKYSPPPTRLLPGRNRVVADLEGAWLPAEVRNDVWQVEFILSTGRPGATGYVVFDNLRGESK